MVGLQNEWIQCLWSAELRTMRDTPSARWRADPHTPYHLRPIVAFLGMTLYGGLYSHVPARTNSVHNRKAGALKGASTLPLRFNMNVQPKTSTPDSGEANFDRISGRYPKSRSFHSKLLSPRSKIAFFTFVVTFPRKNTILEEFEGRSRTALAQILTTPHVILGLQHCRVVPDQRVKPRLGLHGNGSRSNASSMVTRPVPIQIQAARVTSTLQTRSLSASFGGGFL